MICVVCVVSHAGWLMSTSVCDQRVWGRPLPGRLLLVTAPSVDELLQGSINALAGEVSVEEFSNLFPGQAIG